MKLLGMNCKAYLSATLLAGSSHAAVTAVTDWQLFGNLTDVTLNGELDQAETTTRENDGNKTYLATLRDGSVEFESFKDSEDTVQQLLYTAYYSRAPIAALFLDGPRATVGSSGIVANYVVTNITESQPLAEGVKLNVTLKPHSHINVAYEVPSGT